MKNSLCHNKSGSNFTKIESWNSSSSCLKMCSTNSNPSIALIIWVNRPILTLEPDSKSCEQYEGWGKVYLTVSQISIRGNPISCSATKKSKCIAIHKLYDLSDHPLCFVFSCKLDSYQTSIFLCYPRHGITITTIILINIILINSITTIILIYLRRGFLRDVTGGRHFPRKMCAQR